MMREIDDLFRSLKDILGEKFHRWRDQLPKTVIRSMKPERVSHRRFGAEVKMTDASNSGVQVASVDATDARRVTEVPSL